MGTKRPSVPKSQAPTMRTQTNKRRQTVRQAQEGYKPAVTTVKGIVTTPPITIQNVFSFLAAAGIEVTPFWQSPP
jgi:uncharacterized protein (DUF3084 family)